MEMVPDDKARGLKTPIWDDYKKLMNDSEGKEVSSCRCEQYRVTMLLLMTF